MKGPFGFYLKIDAESATKAHGLNVENCPLPADADPTKIKYDEAWSLLRDKSKTILKTFSDNPNVSVRQGKAKPTKANPNPKLEDNRFVMFMGTERNRPGEEVRGPKPLFVSLPAGVDPKQMTLRDCFNLRDQYWKQKTLRQKAGVVDEEVVVVDVVDVEGALVDGVDAVGVVEKLTLKQPQKV